MSTAFWISSTIILKCTRLFFCIHSLPIFTHACFLAHYNWSRSEKKILRNLRQYENSTTRILAFHSFLYFFLSCLPVWFTARFAATVSSFFFSRLLLYYWLRLRSLRETLTRILGRRVIRRGTCWRKQSPRVNTESDERVIVNWENRVISLVISIASDCRYLLSRRYSRGQPICFRHPTFNFAKDNHRPCVYKSRALNSHRIVTIFNEITSLWKIQLEKLKRRLW